MKAIQLQILRLLKGDKNITEMQVPLWKDKESS